MKPETDREIQAILTRINYCAIPVSWKSEDPLPGVGERKSRNRGPGYEFVEFDYFKSGYDDVRTINWSLTAADPRGRLWKTVYQEEKEVKSYVLVKVGNTMDWGSTRTTKRQLAAEMTASIFFALDKTRDKAGLVVYTRDQVLDEHPARSAMSNLFPALESIIEADPDKPNHVQTKGDGLAKALNVLPAQRSLVFIVSDFVDMTQKDWNELANMAVFHDVICLYVQDLRERELPKLPGVLGRIGFFYTFTDADGNKVTIWNNGTARKKWSDNFRQFENTVTKGLRDRQCEWMVVSTEEGDAAIPKVLNLFSSH